MPLGHARRSNRVVVIDLDVRGLNSAIQNAPVLEDRLVIALVDQVLDRVHDRLLQRTTFGERDAVGRDAAALASRLHFSAGRLDLVGRNLRIEKADVSAPGEQRGVRVGLLLEVGDFEVLFAGGGAIVFATRERSAADLLANVCPGVTLFGCSSLHRDRMATHVGCTIHRDGARRRDHPAFARLVVADEIYAFGLAIGCRRKAGKTDQIAWITGGELRNDVVEADIIERAYDPHDLADRFPQVDIPTDDVARGGVDGLVR